MVTLDAQLEARQPTAVQTSFDDLGTPLHAVTFVVLDLETTGTSPTECAITEVGAVKYRGGECLGTFQTLVNPGVPLPPFITVLTGITEQMLVPAPRIGAVLPALLEFCGGSVIVGHNLRFDISFLDAALAARGSPRLSHRRVDTLGLARRLVRDEIPDLRLGTLARHLRTSVRPSHRALDDARATAEVLHALLERAGTLGVTGLDDLLALPGIRAHPSASKLRLTARLPRRPGVYLFRDRAGRILYVGKASDLRARVRSYFSGDDRRKVPQLLRETETIDHIECAHPLEAAVRELRLIHAHQPRFNRQGKGVGRRRAYLKLTLGERFPRLAVVHVARDDGLLVGPLRSAAVAHRLKDAIESAAPIRRCTERTGRTSTILASAPCPAAQLGTTACPCRGHTSEREYAEIVETVAAGLTRDPRLLLDPLERRMHALVEVERFEEAALARDRLATLSRVLTRQQLLDTMAAVRRVRAQTPQGPVDIVGGRLVLDEDATPDADASTPCLDELLLLGRWLERADANVRVVEVDGTLAWRVPRLPVYGPGSRPMRRRR